MPTVHLRLIKKVCLIVVFLFSLACTHQQVGTENTSLEDCDVGNQCSLQGKLTLYSNNYGSLGVLDIRENCVALSLPEHIHRDSRNWTDRRVSVTGLVHSQPIGDGVISYQLESRNVLSGMCEKGKIIYVTEIRKL